MKVCRIRNCQQNKQQSISFCATKLNIYTCSKIKPLTYSAIEKAVNKDAFIYGIDKKGIISAYIMTRYNSKNEKTLISTIKKEYPKRTSTISAKNARADLKRFNKKFPNDSQKQPKLYK